MAFDRDSLYCEREPALIGVVAKWLLRGFIPARQSAGSKSRGGARIRNYERARDKMFSAEERRLCGACLAYASACTARCVHAGARDERETPGTLQHLVWSERGNLFEV
jgi:hypothetical protein